jgi:hypothetical protein
MDAPRCSILAAVSLDCKIRLDKSLVQLQVVAGPNPGLPVLDLATLSVHRIVRPVSMCINQLLTTR